MFKIEPTIKITKEFIFSKISQEQVFEHYLGIDNVLDICYLSIAQSLSLVC